MQNLSLRIKVDPRFEEAHKFNLIAIFLKDWIDSNCNNQVKYTLEVNPSDLDYFLNEYTINVEFDNSEDALALKLKGIPERFQQNVKFMN